jgi:hypothetical protein
MNLIAQLEAEHEELDLGEPFASQRAATYPAGDGTAAARHARGSSLAARLSYLVRQELVLFDPGKVVATGPSASLPQLSFNTTRTALLRLAGLRIGARSRIMGPLRVTGAGKWTELLTIGEYTHVTGPLHVDLAGSVVDAGLVERAYAAVGPARLLFGTDGSMCEGVGKLRGADIPELDKTPIWGQNLRHLLERRTA